MDEVEVEPINLGLELRDAREGPLTASPVIVSSPVLDQRSKLCERRALRPVADGLSIRPTRATESLFQVVEGALRRAVGEGLDSRW
jgi:hypothetical protein